MLRRAEQLLGIPLFDHLTLGHHIGSVSHMAHDPQVVRDQQDGHAELALQILEQLQYLRLDGDVERRRRLVGDQQIGFVGERHGDHHPLALPAGELVREGLEPPLGIGELHQLQQLNGLLACSATAHALVENQSLADLLLD